MSERVLCRSGKGGCDLSDLLRLHRGQFWMRLCKGLCSCDRSKLGLRLRDRAIMLLQIASLAELYELVPYQPRRGNTIGGRVVHIDTNMTLCYINQGLVADSTSSFVASWTCFF